MALGYQLAVCKWYLNDTATSHPNVCHSHFFTVRKNESHRKSTQGVLTEKYVPTKAVDNSKNQRLCALRLP